MIINRNWVVSEDIGRNWSDLFTYQRNEIIAQYPDMKDREGVKWDCVAQHLAEPPRPASDAEGRERIAREAEKSRAPHRASPQRPTAIRPATQPGVISPPPVVIGAQVHGASE